jgi:hypothetical protein
MKVKYEQYVKLKHRLLDMDGCICLAVGETRTTGNGVEAKFICISKDCPEWEVWADKSKIV